MSDKRRVFPLETVLELVAGKKDADVQEITGFILGKTVDCETCSKAAAPFAAAWLARWYPQFMDLEWKEDESWNNFVTRARGKLGDNISLPPMTGRLHDLVNVVLGSIAEANESLERQTQAAISLEKRVKELEPHEKRANAAQKKCDELENKIKCMKSDMGALQRVAQEYQGKLAINHDELMDNIKEAIKDGMRGFAIGAATEAAGPEGAAQAIKEAEKDENKVPDDFGFGNSGTDSDGFGF